MLTLKLNEDALAHGVRSIPPEVLKAVHVLDAHAVVFAVKWDEVWIRSHQDLVDQASPTPVRPELRPEPRPEPSPPTLKKPPPEQKAIQVDAKEVDAPKKRRQWTRREGGPPQGLVWVYVEKKLRSLRVGERVSISLPDVPDDSPGVTVSYLQNKIAAWCGQHWGRGQYATQQFKERGVVEVWRLKPPFSGNDL